MKESCRFRSLWTGLKWYNRDICIIRHWLRFENQIHWLRFENQMNEMDLIEIFIRFGI